MTEIIYSKATMRILLLRIHEGMEVLAGEVVINANSKCVLSAITGVITHVFVEEGELHVFLLYHLDLILMLS